MGFQSGLNQALGAVAGAAFAGKNAQEAKQEKITNAKKAQEAKQEKITNTKLDLDFSMAELAQAQAHAAESGAAVDEARKETKSKAEAYKESKKHLDANGNKVTSKQGKYYAKEAEEQAFDDLMAATKAESILNKKYFANEAMVNRFKNRVSVLQDRLNKLGGIK